MSALQERWTIGGKHWLDLVLEGQEEIIAVDVGASGRVRWVPQGKCQLCGVWRERLQIDHIKPVSGGGGSDPANIQLLCANCHEDKTLGENRARIPSEETKARISKALAGRPLSLEHRARLSESHRRRYG